MEAAALYESVDRMIPELLRRLRLSRQAEQHPAAPARGQRQHAPGHRVTPTAQNKPRPGSTA